MNAAAHKVDQRDHDQQHMREENSQRKPSPERLVIPVRKKDRTECARHDQDQRDLGKKRSCFALSEGREKVNEDAHVA